MQYDYTYIPKILKELNIWLCFDDRDKDYFINLSDKEIKQEKASPRDLKGKKCSKNGRLYSFNECIESVKKGYNTGLGIVLKKNGLVVLDYDNCISEYKTDDKLGITIPIFNTSDADRIQRDIDLINSYTEISPSGKGIHIYLTANSNINTNTGKIEIYTDKFIRVSGNLFNEFMYNELKDRTEELEQLLNYYGLSDLMSSSNRDILSKKDNFYKDILNTKFKYTNGYTNKQILDTMFDSKNGEFLKALYYNTISDRAYQDYKTERLNVLIQKGIITRAKYEEMYNKIDLSDSGKAFTLIMNLLHYSYGDIDAVYTLFKNSALCRDDYLVKRYKNKTQDKIRNQFIPKAIEKYVNFEEY